MPPLAPTALFLGGVAALIQASLKAIDGKRLVSNVKPSTCPSLDPTLCNAMHPYIAKEAATSVAEAAGPYLAAAFVLCLVGVLAGAGSLKPTHLSEDPAIRWVHVYTTSLGRRKASRASDGPSQSNINQP